MPEAEEVGKTGDKREREPVRGDGGRGNKEKRQITPSEERQNRNER